MQVVIVCGGGPYSMVKTTGRAMRGVLRTAQAITSELFEMSKKAATPSSFFRYAADLFLLRVTGPSDSERQIGLRDGILLTYRLNRGDMQSVREVWLDEAYKLPFELKSEVLIDLGANIGLTSVWLAKRYGYSIIIAVEPSPSNVRLTRMNLHSNNINASVIEGAVGPNDGTAHFDESEASNLGRVSSVGRSILMLSMQSVLAHLPEGTSVDLVKMDIEGGEEALLQGDLTWLNRVRSIIAEFHPSVIDYERAIRSLQDAGFCYFRAGSAHKNSMDAFAKSA